MTLRTFAVRDSGTSIPVLAIALSAADSWLFARAGFGDDRYVVMLNLVTLVANYSEFRWTGGRTLTHTHHYIKAHWDELEDGALIDVQFILGETLAPKRSEQRSRL